MKGWLITALLLASFPAGAACVDATEELQAMDRSELVLTGPGGRTVTLAVRVADDGRERGAGFQQICPETIANTAIYFVFARARRPAFHMSNVKAPLDIAFIDGEGVIVDIQRMQTYAPDALVRPVYSPPGRVAAALETRVGYFDDQGINAGNWKVELQRQ